MDILDIQSVFLAGAKVKMIFPDGTSVLAEQEEDIANMAGIVEFEIEA